MGDNYVPVMECTVLSVAEDVFRAKKPGETDRTMYRLYMADAHGRVGYLYSSKAHAGGRRGTPWPCRAGRQTAAGRCGLIRRISNRANLAYKCTAAR